MNLQVIEDYLTAAGLTTGYTIKWYRWDDADLGNPKEKFFVLKQDGGGAVTPYFSRPAYRILLVGGKKENPSDGGNLSEQIITQFMENHTTGEIMQFQVLSDKIGPLFIENDRPIWEVNFTALTNRSDDV